MNLFVDPACRGSGVCRALIDAARTEAKSNGIPVTYWMTQEFNYKGRILYDQVAQRAA